MGRPPGAFPAGTRDRPTSRSPSAGAVTPIVSGTALRDSPLRRYMPVRCSVRSFSDHFSPNEKGIFEPVRGTLLTSGDFYMHLADLTSYIHAHERLGELYANPDAWTR